jgi:hypothetical protein
MTCSVHRFARTLLLNSITVISAFRQKDDFSPIILLLQFCYLQSSTYNTSEHMVNMRTCQYLSRHHRVFDDGHLVNFDYSHTRVPYRSSGTLAQPHRDLHIFTRLPLVHRPTHGLDTGLPKRHLHHQLHRPRPLPHLLRSHPRRFQYLLR